MQSDRLGSGEATCGSLNPLNGASNINSSWFLNLNEILEMELKLVSDATVISWTNEGLKTSVLVTCSWSKQVNDAKGQHPISVELELPYL